jgi:HAE1 family hydrophobic/amphiphilic exporter-1
VDISGGRDREIHLDADPEKLIAHNVNLRQIASMVRQSNFNSPSGSIAQGLKETSVRVVGEPAVPEDLGRIGVPLGQGQTVRLNRIVQVKDTLAEERNRARHDGEDAVLLELIARPNANIVKVARAVRAELGEIRPSLQGSIELDVVYDSSEFVDESVRNVIRDMAIGTVLTALVLFLFLQQFGATVAVAISMPASIIGTFIPMYLFGFTLNVMSTLGLAISVGVLVNNAILVLENIYRYRELGKDPKEAAEIGTREIEAAVISTTATNLGVFIPVAFMGGMVGQFFYQFALTVVFATLFSLWGAFTVTPMVAARIGKGVHSVSRPAKVLTGWWQWIYRSLEIVHEEIVPRCVRHPFLTLAFFAFLVAVSLFFGRDVAFEFFPKVDEGVILARVELSSSASLDATDDIVRRVEASLMEKPYVESISTNVGGGRRLGGKNNGSVRAYLVDENERASAFAIASQLRREFASLPDADVTVDVSSGRGGGGGKPVQVTLTGPDLDMLNKISRELLEKLRDVPGLVDLGTDWEVGRYELRLSPEYNRLASLNVTLDGVSEELRGYLSGIDAGVFREEGFEYDILVQLSEKWRDSPSRVPDLPIWSSAGFVPLRELADITMEQGPTAIYRLDRQRKITIEADTANRSVGEVFQDIRPIVDEMNLPPGYGFVYEGDIQNIQENFMRLGLAFGMATLLTFLLIAGIIESYLFSLIIMLTLPLSVIGVVPVLLVTETTLSIYGLLGMIMLVGLVVNNAIIVVDYAEVLRKEGKHPTEAVLEAVSVRLRPILMADVTTLIAMLPLALGLGAGGQYRAPLAIVLIGGLVAGGTMALFLIPPIYAVVWDLKDRFKRRFLHA